MKTVPLHGKTAAGRVALVDDADYDLVMQYRWTVHEYMRPGARRLNGPYARTFWRVDGKVNCLLMHTLITGFARVDHEDHDGLNNQRHNLREATDVQNGRNKRTKTGSSSRYKGVYRDQRRGRWRASIKDIGKVRCLGTFPDEVSAAQAYDAAARAAFGEFACLNFPD
jgi:hypothetical protein